MRARRMAVVGALLLVCVVPTGSLASVVGGTDGNDTRGPLDLAKVRISHASKTSDSILIQTIAPFRNEQIDGKRGNFVLAFSWDGGRHVQRFGYVFFARGRLQGVLVNNHGSVDGRFRVARAGGRGVVLKLLHAEMADLSYRVVVFSVWRETPCAKRCVDALPNRGSLLHDIVPPTVKPLKFGNLDEFSVASGDEVTFPVSFSMEDDKFGSGIGRWKLQRSNGPTWETVATGHAKSPTVQAPGTQGEQYSFRVIARDRQNNLTTSAIRGVPIPVDDSSSLITYDASWTTASAASWYLSTRTLGAQGGQLSFTFKGDKVCFLRGPTSGPTALANYLVTPVGPHSTFGGTVGANGTTPLGYAGSDCTTLDMDTWTLTVTVTSAEPLPLDGFIVYRNAPH